MDNALSNDALIPLVSVVIPTRNAFAQTAATLRALFDQTLPPQATMEIIVVDDASTDNAAERLAAEFGSRIVLIRQEQNQGRSATRNRGAQAATGRWLAMLDCDCQPCAANYLSSLLSSLTLDRVCIGRVQYQAHGFWADYQKLGARRRLRAHRDGQPGALSTACMAMDRQAFLDVGGYDEDYRHYGFEDRDLLLRLSTAGLTVIQVDAAKVRHSDPVNLCTLMMKNIEIGQYTAPQFRASHPQAFARLDYAYIDVALHPLRARLGAMAGWLLLRWARSLEQLLEYENIPMSARLLMAKCTLASAYCLGSVRSRKDACSN